MTVEQAAKLFVDRQDRVSHPDGKSDNGGRWIPSNDEWCSCCAAIRYPSRSWPWSLMVHCRTAEHVAALTGVPAADIRREARQIRKAREQVAVPC